MSVNGRVVPLKVPPDSAKLRILQSLRGHASQLRSRLESLRKLDDHLDVIGQEPHWNAMIPVASQLTLGYAKGRIIDTGTVTINLGGGEQHREGDSGYWVEYTVDEARSVAERKRAGE